MDDFAELVIRGSGGNLSADEPFPDEEARDECALFPFDVRDSRIFDIFF